MRSNVQLFLFILPGYVHSSLGLASVTQCHLGCWIVLMEEYLGHSMFKGELIDGQVL